MSGNEAEFAIRAAIRQAYGRRNEYVTVEHLLYALLFDESASNIIHHCGGDPDEIKSDLDSHLDGDIPTLPKEAENADPKQTLGFRRVLERAILQVQASDRATVRSADLLVSVLEEQESYAAYVLKTQGVTRMAMLEYISDESRASGDAVRHHRRDSEEAYERPIAKPLEKFTVDITEMARAGKLDPLIGRLNSAQFCSH